MIVLVEVDDLPLAVSLSVSSGRFCLQDLLLLFDVYKVGHSLEHFVNVVARVGRRFKQLDVVGGRQRHPHLGRDLPIVLLVHLLKKVEL